MSIPSELRKCSGKRGTMDRPMTTTEFFEKLCGILKAGGMMPDILDYGLPGRNEVPIRTSDFCLSSSLDYGGSEGIYLDLWIEYEEEGSKRKAALGTFKTLHEDRSAMRTMAILLADIIVEGYGYLRRNSDDFTWEGFWVYALDGAGKKLHWYYECVSEAEVLAKKEELLRTYPAVMVKDNSSRSERIYREL